MPRKEGLVKFPCRQFVAITCALALVAFSVPGAAFADQDPLASDAAAEALSESNIDDASSDIWEETIAIDLQTSAQREAAIAPFSLSRAAGVPLAAGNHEKWIDRVVLPDYAKNLYNALVEATDDDGYCDYLIEDAYFEGRAATKGAYAARSGAGYLLVRAMTAQEAASSAVATELTQAVSAALAAFDRDHPEVFWLSGSYGLQLVGAGKTVTAYLVLSDGQRDMRSSEYASQFAIETDIRKREQCLRSILQGAPASPTQYTLVRYFNQWLTRNNEYNTAIAAGSMPAEHAPWECLSALEGRAGVRGPVCEGYARALKVLCDRVGIGCVLVDGTARDPYDGAFEPHMWNNVRIDRTWYGVDATWNDPFGGAAGKLSGIENENWLLKGSATVCEGRTFEWTHPVENLVYSGGVRFVNGPVLSSEAYNPADGAPATSVSLPPIPAAPKRTLSQLALGKTSYAFDGKIHQPSVAVVGSGGVRLVQNRDYTVKISGNRKSVGTYRVTVTGINSCAGTLSATYKITAPTVKKVAKPALKSSKRKTLTATWKRVTGNVSGYQVQACTSKKFKKSVSKKTVKLTKKTKKSKTYKITLKKLKAKKAYYVRVRAYYKIGGKTFYGKWSTVKKVRVK